MSSPSKNNNNNNNKNNSNSWMNQIAPWYIIRPLPKNKVNPTQSDRDFQIYKRNVAAKIIQSFLRQRLNRYRLRHNLTNHITMALREIAQVHINYTNNITNSNGAAAATAATKNLPLKNIVLTAVDLVATKKLFFLLQSLIEETLDSERRMGQPIPLNIRFAEEVTHNSEKIKQILRYQPSATSNNNNNNNNNDSSSSLSVAEETFFVQFVLVAPFGDEDSTKWYSSGIVGSKTTQLVVLKTSPAQIRLHRLLDFVMRPASKSAQASGRGQCHFPPDNKRSSPTSRFSIKGITKELESVEAALSDVEICQTIAYDSTADIEITAAELLTSLYYFSRGGTSAQGSNPATANVSPRFQQQQQQPNSSTNNPFGSRPNSSGNPFGNSLVLPMSGSRPVSAGTVGGVPGGGASTHFFGSTLPELQMTGPEELPGNVSFTSYRLTPSILATQQQYQNQQQFLQNGNNSVSEFPDNGGNRRLSMPPVSYGGAGAGAGNYGQQQYSPGASVFNPRRTSAAGGGGGGGAGGFGNSGFFGTSTMNMNSQANNNNNNANARSIMTFSRSVNATGRADSRASESTGTATPMGGAAAASMGRSTLAVSYANHPLPAASLRHLNSVSRGQFLIQGKKVFRFLQKCWSISCKEFAISRNLLVRPAADIMSEQLFVKNLAKTSRRLYAQSGALLVPHRLILVACRDVLAARRIAWGCVQLLCVAGADVEFLQIRSNASIKDVEQACEMIRKNPSVLFVVACPAFKDVECWSEFREASSNLYINVIDEEIFESAAAASQQQQNNNRSIKLAAMANKKGGTGGGSNPSLPPSPRRAQSANNNNNNNNNKNSATATTKSITMQQQGASVRMAASSSFSPQLDDVYEAVSIFQNQNAILTSELIFSEETTSRFGDRPYWSNEEEYVDDILAAWSLQFVSEFAHERAEKQRANTLALEKDMNQKSLDTKARKIGGAPGGDENDNNNNNDDDEDQTDDMSGTVEFTRGLRPGSSLSRTSEFSDSDDDHHRNPYDITRRKKYQAKVRQLNAKAVNIKHKTDRTKTDASESELSRTDSAGSGSDDDNERGQAPDESFNASRRKRFQTKVPKVFDRDWKSATAPNSVQLVLHSTIFFTNTTFKNAPIITAVITAAATKKELYRVEGTASYRGVIVFDRSTNPDPAATPNFIVQKPKPDPKIKDERKQNDFLSQQVVINLNLYISNLTSPQNLFARATIDLTQMFVGGQERKLWLRIPVVKVGGTTAASSAVCCGSALIGLQDTFKIREMNSGDRQFIFDLANEDRDLLKSNYLLAEEDELDVAGQNHHMQLQVKGPKTVTPSILAIRPASMALSLANFNPSVENPLSIEVLYRKDQQQQQAQNNNNSNNLVVISETVLTNEGGDLLAPLQNLSQFGSILGYQVRIDKKLTANEPFWEVPFSSSLANNGNNFNSPKNNGWLLFALSSLYSGIEGITNMPRIEIFDDSPSSTLLLEENHNNHNNNIKKSGGVSIVDPSSDSIIPISPIRPQQQQNNNNIATNHSKLIWSTDFFTSSSDNGDQSSEKTQNNSSLWFFNILDGSGAFTISISQVKKLRFVVTPFSSNDKRESVIDFTNEKIQMSLFNEPSNSVKLNFVPPASKKYGADATDADTWVLSLFTCRADFTEEQKRQQQQELQEMLEQQSANAEPADWFAEFPTNALARYFRKNNENDGGSSSMNGNNIINGNNINGNNINSRMIRPMSGANSNANTAAASAARASDREFFGPFCIVASDNGNNNNPSQQKNSANNRNNNNFVTHIAVSPAASILPISQRQQQQQDKVSYAVALFSTSIPRYSGAIQVTLTSPTVAKTLVPNHQLMLPNASVPFNILESHILMMTSDQLQNPSANSESMKVKVSTSGKGSREITINNWREQVLKSSASSSKFTLNLTASNATMNASTKEAPKTGAKSSPWKVTFFVYEAYDFNAAVDKLYRAGLSSNEVTCFNNNNNNNQQQHQEQQNQPQLRLPKVVGSEVQKSQQFLQNPDSSWITCKLFSVSGLLPTSKSTISGGVLLELSSNDGQSALLPVGGASSMNNNSNNSPLRRRESSSANAAGSTPDPTQATKFEAPLLLGSAIIPDSRRLHVAIKKNQFPVKVSATVNTIAITTTQSKTSSKLQQHQSQQAHTYEGLITFEQALQALLQQSTVQLNLNLVQPSRTNTQNQILLPTLTARLVLSAVSFPAETAPNKLAVAEVITRGTVDNIERWFRSLVQELEKPAHEETFDVPAALKDALAQRAERQKTLRVLVFSDEEQRLDTASWHAGAASESLAPRSVYGLSNTSGEIAIQNMDGENVIDRITVGGLDVGQRPALCGLSDDNEDAWHIVGSNLGMVRLPLEDNELLKAGGGAGGGIGKSGGSESDGGRGGIGDDDDEDNPKLNAGDLFSPKMTEIHNRVMQHQHQLAGHNANDVSGISAQNESATFDQEIPQGFVVLSVHSVWGLRRGGLQREVTVSMDKLPTLAGGKDSSRFLSRSGSPSASLNLPASPNSPNSSPKNNNNNNENNFPKQEPFFKTHAYISANSINDFPNHVAIPTCCYLTPQQQDSTQMTNSMMFGDEVLISIETSQKDGGVKWTGALDLYTATQVPYMMIPVTLNAESQQQLLLQQQIQQSNINNNNNNNESPARGIHNNNHDAMMMTPTTSKNNNNNNNAYFGGSSNTNNHDAAISAASPQSFYSNNNNNALSPLSGGTASAHQDQSPNNANNRNNQLILQQGVRAYVLVLCSFAPYSKEQRDETERRRTEYKEKTKSLTLEAQEIQEQICVNPAEGEKITNGKYLLRPTIFDLAVIHSEPYYRDGLIRAQHLDQDNSIQLCGEFSTALNNNNQQQNNNEFISPIKRELPLASTILQEQISRFQTHMMQKLAIPTIMKAEAQTILTNLQFLDKETTEPVFEGFELSTGMLDRSESEVVELKTPQQSVQFLTTALRFDPDALQIAGCPAISVLKNVANNNKKSAFSSAPPPSSAAAAMTTTDSGNNGIAGVFIMIHSCFFFNVDNDLATALVSSSPVVVEARRGGWSRNENEGLNCTAASADNHGSIHKWRDPTSCSFIQLLNPNDTNGEITIDFDVISANGYPNKKTIVSRGSVDISIAQLVTKAKIAAKSGANTGKLSSSSIRVVDLSGEVNNNNNNNNNGNMMDGNSSYGDNNSAPSHSVPGSSNNLHTFANSTTTAPENNNNNSPGNHSHSLSPPSHLLQPDQITGLQGELRVSLVLVTADRNAAAQRELRVTAFEKNLLKQRRLMICKKKNISAEVGKEAEDALNKHFSGSERPTAANQSSRKFRILTVDRVLLADGSVPPPVDPSSAKALTCQIGTEDPLHPEPYSQFSVNSRNPTGSKTSLVPTNVRVKLAVAPTSVIGDEKARGDAEEFNTLDGDRLVNVTSNGDEIPKVTSVDLRKKRDWKEIRDQGIPENDEQLPPTTELTVTTVPVEYLNPTVTGKMKNLDDLLRDKNNQGDLWFAFTCHSGCGLIPRRNGEKRNIYVAIEDAEGRELHRTNVVQQSLDPVFDLNHATVLLPLEQWGSKREINIRVLDNNSKVGFDAPVGYCCRLNVHELCREAYNSETAGVVQVLPLEPEQIPELLEKDDLGFLRCSVGIARVSQKTKDAVEAEKQRKRDDMIRQLEREQKIKLDELIDDGVPTHRRDIGGKSGAGVSQIDNNWKDVPEGELEDRDKFDYRWITDPVTGNRKRQKRPKFFNDLDKIDQLVLVSVRAAHTNAPHHHGPQTLAGVSKENSVDGKLVSSTPIDSRTDATITATHLLAKQPLTMRTQPARNAHKVGSVSSDDPKEQQKKDGNAQQILSQPTAESILVPTLRPSRHLDGETQTLLSHEWQQPHLKIAGNSSSKNKNEEETANQNPTTTSPSLICSTHPVVISTTDPRSRVQKKDNNNNNSEGESKSERRDREIESKNKNNRNSNNALVTPAWIGLSFNSLLLTELQEGKLKPGRNLFVSLEDSNGFVRVCTQSNPLQSATRFDFERDRIIFAIPASALTPIPENNNNNNNNTKERKSNSGLGILTARVFIHHSRFDKEPVCVATTKIDLSSNGAAARFGEELGQRQIEMNINPIPQYGNIDFTSNANNNNSSVPASSSAVLSAAPDFAAKTAILFYTTFALEMTPEQVQAEKEESERENESAFKQLDDEASNALHDILNEPIRVVELKKCEAPSDYAKTFVKVSKMKQKKSDDADEDASAVIIPSISVEGEKPEQQHQQQQHPTGPASSSSSQKQNLNAITRVTDKTTIFALPENNSAMICKSDDKLQVAVEGTQNPDASNDDNDRELLLLDELSERDMTMSRDGTLLPQVSTKRAYPSQHDARGTRGNIPTSLTVNTIPVVNTSRDGLPTYHDGYYVIRVHSLSNVPKRSQDGFKINPLVQMSSPLVAENNKNNNNGRKKAIGEDDVFGDDNDVDDDEVDDEYSARINPSSPSAATDSKNLLHTFPFFKKSASSSNTNNNNNNSNKNSNNVSQSEKDQQNETTTGEDTIDADPNNHLYCPEAFGLVLVKANGQKSQKVTLRLSDLDEAFSYRPSSDKIASQFEKSARNPSAATALLGGSLSTKKNYGTVTVDLGQVSRFNRERVYKVYFNSANATSDNTASNPQSSPTNNKDGQCILRLVCTEVELPLEQRALTTTNVAEHFVLPTKTEYSDPDLRNPTSICGLASMEFVASSNNKMAASSYLDNKDTLDNVRIPLLSHAAMKWMLLDYGPEFWHNIANNKIKMNNNNNGQQELEEGDQEKDGEEEVEEEINQVLLDAATNDDFYLSCNDYLDEEQQQRKQQFNSNTADIHEMIFVPEFCPLEKDPTSASSENNNSSSATSSDQQLALPGPSCRFRFLSYEKSRSELPDELLDHLRLQEKVQKQVSSAQGIMNETLRQNEGKIQQTRSQLERFRQSLLRLNAVEQYCRDHIAHEYIHQLLMKLVTNCCWVARSQSESIGCVLRYREWERSANRSTGVAVNSAMLAASIYSLDFRFREFYHPSLELLLIDSFERQERIGLMEKQQTKDVADEQNLENLRSFPAVEQAERIRRVNIELVEESERRNMMRNALMSMNRLQMLREMAPYLSGPLRSRGLGRQDLSYYPGYDPRLMGNQQLLSQMLHQSPPPRTSADSQPLLGGQTGDAFASINRPNTANPPHSMSLLNRLRKLEASRNDYDHDPNRSQMKKKSLGWVDNASEEDRRRQDRLANRPLQPYERILAAPAPYPFRGVGATELELAFSCTTFQLAQSHLERFDMSLDLHLLNEAVHIITQRVLAREPVGINSSNLLSPLTALFGQPRHAAMLNFNVAKALAAAWRARFPMIDLYKDDPSSELLILLQRRQALSGGGAALKDAVCALVAQTAMRIGVEASASRVKRTIFNLQRLLRVDKLEGVIPITGLLNAASTRTESLRQAISYSTKKASPGVILRYRQCEAIEAAILLEIARLSRARPHCYGELHLSYESLKYIVFAAFRNDSPAQVEATPDPDNIIIMTETGKDGFKTPRARSARQVYRKNSTTTTTIPSGGSTATTGSPGGPAAGVPVTAGVHESAQQFLSTPAPKMNYFPNDASPARNFKEETAFYEKSFNPHGNNNNMDAFSPSPHNNNQNSNTNQNSNNNNGGGGVQAPLLNSLFYQTQASRNAIANGALIPEMMCDLEANLDYNLNCRAFPTDAVPTGNNISSATSVSQNDRRGSTVSAAGTEEYNESNNYNYNNNNNATLLSNASTAQQTNSDPIDGRKFLFEDPFEVIFVLLHEILMNGTDSMSLAGIPGIGAQYNNNNNELGRYEASCNIPWTKPVFAAIAIDKLPLSKAGTSSASSSSASAVTGALLKRAIAARAPHSFFRADCAFNFLANEAFEASSSETRTKQLFQTSKIDELEPQHSVTEIAGVTKLHPFTRLDVISHQQPNHVHAAIRLLMEAADAPPKFAGHSNAITGLKNWIEAVGPKYVLGQLLLPRSAEIFALSLPMRVISDAEKLIITPAMSRASGDSRGSGRGSTNNNLTPIGGSAVLPPPTVTNSRYVPQPPASPMNSSVNNAINMSNNNNTPRNNLGNNNNNNNIIIVKNSNISGSSSALPPPGPSSAKINNNNNNMSSATPPPRLGPSTTGSGIINNSNNNMNNNNTHVTFTPQPPRSVSANLNQNNNFNASYTSLTNQQQDVYAPAAADQLSPDITAAINSISSVHPGLGRAIALTTAAAMLSRAEI